MTPNILKEVKSQILKNALYIVATPIGNLQDVTLRAIAVLEEVDVILCEDSRVAAKLLQALKITKKKLITYNDQSDEKSRHNILDLILKNKSVALISDAGTPLISDPGFKLVSFLRERGQNIVPIPGPSALTAALCGSGLACENFIFLGFLPPKKESKTKLILGLSSKTTVICFEASSRLIKTLEILEKIMPNRRLAIARELTKIHEEFLVDYPAKLIEIFSKNPEKICGEVVLIIEKISKNDQESIVFAEQNLSDEIIEMLKQKISPRQISQELATNFSVGKKDIYRLAVELKSKKR